MSWINITGLKVTSSVSDEKTRLTETRWHLRDEIARLLQDKEGRSKPEVTIASYNEVVETLYSLEVGPRVDPMDKLPSEIITYIMLEVSAYKASWYTSRFVDSLIHLTMVSKRWRSFILSEPLLWNGISLDNNADVCAITSMQLTLSKDLPLTFQVHLPFEQWTSVRSDIIKHRDRIETIVFSGFYPYHKSREKDKDIRKILEDLGPLPSLRQLGESYRPYGEGYDVSWIIDHCQSLKEIVNIPISAKDLRLAQSRLTIREMTTYERIDNILPLVEPIKELRKVVFLTDYPPFPPEDVNKSATKSTFPSTHPLSWTHLTYDLYNSRVPKPLLHRLPDLVMLEISADFHTLQYLVSIADQFPKLGRFRAMTSLNIHDKIALPDNISPNCNVHTLELYISHEGYYALPKEDNPDVDRLCQSVHIVPEMMIHAMPYAQYLSLSINGMFSEFPFFSLDDCFTGEEIYLSFSKCGVLPMPGCRIPPSVERLSVGCDRALTCSLSSKTLMSLFIWETYPEEEESAAPSPSSSPLPMLDLDAWPSLEIISFYDNWILWSKHSLTSLKNVSIRKGHGKSIVHNDVTSFIRDIARSPESYPSLEELDFEECPEWDMFIIMLERRNLLASKGVARITKLTIPALCPLWIYQIISQLLLGKWVERPSNRELSLAGNAEIILDLSLPGCYLCHRALRRCGTPVKKNWKPEPDYDEKAFLARLQEYPDSDDEILDTWEERKKLWESWNKGKGGREMSCESQVAIDLKPMNQDSCEEHPDTWVKELSTSVDPKTV